jgi:hypothetical protein
MTIIQIVIIYYAIGLIVTLLALDPHVKKGVISWWLFAPWLWPLQILMLLWELVRKIKWRQFPSDHP